MDQKLKKVFTDILGEEGFSKLSKAIERRGSLNVADPLELYLPLMVVPRTILAWLVQNIKPMKTGDVKQFKYPGQEDIVIEIQKQNTDVYRGELIKEGRIIHAWDKQTLPNIGGHLMTVFELYDHLTDLDEDEGVQKPSSVSDLATHIIQTNSLMPSVLPPPPKSDMQSVMETMGKLVDALVAKYGSKGKSKEEIEYDKNPKTKEPKKEKIEGGLADKKTIKDIAEKHKVSIELIEKQLERGIKVEMEHTKDESMAREIAMDHLWEDPNYYTHLNEMEEKAKEEKTDKAEMPAGAGSPRPPSAPKMPVGPSKHPDLAQKQTMASAQGKQQVAQQPKPAMKPHTPAMKTEDLDLIARKKHLLMKLKKKAIKKSEKHIYSLSEEEIYKKCPHCGVSEFIKSEDGTPKFHPCMCYWILTKNEKGNSTWFLRLSKGQDGYRVKFNPNADPESIRSFLLMLKSRIKGK